MTGKLIARLTAGTTFKPEGSSGPGKKPELTNQEIALACATVSGIGCHLVLAKFADNEVAKLALPAEVARLSWSLWFERNRSGPITMPLMDRIAGHALNEYLAPGRERPLSAVQHATRVGISDKTWSNRYAEHFADLLGALLTHEAKAAREIRKTLFGT